jgi:hypothetical protein
MTPSRPSRDPVPAAVWMAFLGVALLRLVPFAWVLLGGADDPGTVHVPVGFIPKDMLAYAALVRQSPGWALLNPFTTDAQQGRLVLLLLQGLGAVRALTGADPFWLLELSRVPLLLLLAKAVWDVTGAVLETRPHRVRASLLVAFGGGVEWLLPLVADLLPPDVAMRARQDLWHLYGWHTFQAAYNPQWVAGLALSLWTLSRLLAPGGLETVRGRAAVSALLAALWFLHPYGVLFVLAVVGSQVVLERLLGVPWDGGREARRAVALLPGLAVIGAVSLWQLQDDVFRRTAGGVLGTQAPAFSWLPVAYGVTLVFALRGVRDLAGPRRAWALAFGAWIGGGLLLATSRVLNGYHFVSYLHVPLCLLAAGPFSDWLDDRRRRGTAGAAAAATLVGVLAFASPAWSTVEALKDAQREGVVPASAMEAVRVLAQRPTGGVLCPPAIGNLVPAYSDHSVYVGQWFMTPDFPGRSDWYEALLRDSATEAPRLLSLVQAGEVRYLLAPRRARESLATALAPRQIPVETVGGLDLWTFF